MAVKDMFGGEEFTNQEEADAELERWAQGHLRAQGRPVSDWRIAAGLPPSPAAASEPANLSVVAPNRRVVKISEEERLAVATLIRRDPSMRTFMENILPDGFCRQVYPEAYELRR